MYEVISWQNLLQEKDESCFVFVTGSKTSARVHRHMHAGEIQKGVCEENKPGLYVSTC